MLAWNCVAHGFLLSIPVAGLRRIVLVFRARLVSEKPGCRSGHSPHPRLRPLPLNWSTKSPVVPGTTPRSVGFPSRHADARCWSHRRNLTRTGPDHRCQRCCVGGPTQTPRPMSQTPSLPLLPRCGLRLPGPLSGISYVRARRPTTSFDTLRSRRRDVALRPSCRRRGAASCGPPGRCSRPARGMRYFVRGLFDGLAWIDKLGAIAVCLRASDGA